MTVTSRADGDSESESLRLRSVRLYAVIDGPTAGLNLKPLMPRDHAAAAPTLALGALQSQRIQPQVAEPHMLTWAGILACTAVIIQMASVARTS